MNTYNRLFILSFLLLSALVSLSAQEQTITISRHEYEQILHRLEALEKAQDTLKAQKVDAYSSATRRVDSTQASADTAQQSRVPRWIHNRLTIGGYGEVAAKYCFFSNNYLRYGKTPEKYANDRYGEVDLPHVVINLGYDFGHGWSMGTEIEFEHGGTESAIEIEEEEGGEYESEIERGGEVALEQFWLQKRFNDYAVIRAGMQVVPVGALNANHEPVNFFSVYRNEGEYTILPSTWHEVALTFMGQTPKGWHYQVMLLPGLDSDRFNRKNWIKPGAGSPYEFKIANVWAGAARVDYTGVKGLRLSLSGYAGTSFKNTLSKSLVELKESTYNKVRGLVTIGSFDFAYNDYGWIVRGNATYGHLGDAAAITQYNLAMRKGSVSSKQWVASDAMAVGIEAGYDFFTLSPKLRNQNQRFFVFARYDFYDSMLLYDGQRNRQYAWCGRQRAAFGINYYPIKQIGVKAEFSYGILNKGTRADGTVGKLYNDEPQIAIGIVYAGWFRP